MDVNVRNGYMVDHDHLIHAAIRRNRTLLKALRLETEDVYQDLAMAMLKAIDGFDPSRSSSLDAHINAKLHYAILDIKRKHKPGGVIGREGKYVTITSVECFHDGDRALELPVYDAFDDVDISDALAALTAPERETLRNSMDGEKPGTRDQRDLLESAKAKIMSFYRNGELLATC